MRITGASGCFLANKLSAPPLSGTRRGGAGADDHRFARGHRHDVWRVAHHGIASRRAGGPAPDGGGEWTGTLSRHGCASTPTSGLSSLWETGRRSSNSRSRRVHAIVITGGLPLPEEIRAQARAANVTIVGSPHDTATTVLMARGAVHVEQMLETSTRPFTPKPRGRRPAVSPLNVELHFPGGR